MNHICGLAAAVAGLACAWLGLAAAALGQGAHDVRYLRYWGRRGPRAGVLPGRGHSADAVAEVHQQAHGLVADHIYQVQEGS